MTVKFWSNDPYILLNKNYISALWPTSQMCYEEKLNSITRLIILLTIFGFLITFSYRFLFVGIFTIFVIYYLYVYNKPKITKEKIKEEFIVKGDKVYDLAPTNPTEEVNNSLTLEQAAKDQFMVPNKKNPFGNVLLTQINGEPNRLSAPPVFNPEIEENVTKNVKKAVQFMNPDIKNTDKQLYSSLWDKFELEQSNRLFYSTANTRVANDQTAYAKYLYGNMPSAKGSTMEDNIQREKDNYRYILY